MSRLDLVIFGATGFTGKHAVMEFARLSKKYPEMTWGVAGRSQAKLKELMDEISKNSGVDLTSVKIIVADVQDEKSLKEMCSQAKVIVNCCGPYRHIGEPVVKAAIDSKTNYVDVSGEPQFMETMQLQYDKAARDAGVYVISACGFDSIPNDMGVIYLQQNFGGTLNSVESYLSTSASLAHAKEGLVNTATWASLVHGVAHFNELPTLRKKLYPERLPTFKPKLKSRSVLHKRGAGWCVPFPGADAAVVYRTQRRLYDSDQLRPAQIKTYIKLPSLFLAVSLLFAAIIFFIFTRTRIGIWLLVRFPEFFSLGMVKKNPPEESVSATKFTFELYGEGWNKGADVHSCVPDKRVKVKVSGTNPGYGATVVSLLFSAITILKQADKMPEPGVLTTGAAFRNTDLIKHLHENNVKFEIVDYDE